MATSLIELVENFPAARVVLVGDFMLDKYIFGSTSRVSPEAPIPVLRYQREEYRLGGAGFVMAALGTLGAKVKVVGVVGADQAGEELRKRLVEAGANVDGLIVASDRPTVAKTRLLGSSEDRSPQQMIRLDVEETGAIAGKIADELLQKAFEAMREADLLCLEDYDKGVLPPAVCAKLIEMAQQRKLPVLIDPARLKDYGKYTGATALKMNLPEARICTGESSHETAATTLLSKLNLEAVIVTLNDDGAYLATSDGERALLSSRPRQVADATGAGDTVLAMLCMARAAGASWADAVALGNVAAGLEVERLGCVPILPSEIIHDLMMEHHEESGKERTIATLLPELQRHRAAGRKIVFTNGCFDLIHLGHVKYFQFARSQGDILVVGVNTDGSISRLKGPKRPVVNESDRVGVLEELESIDYLIRFDEDTPLKLIEAIKPDVLVKGEDYSKSQVVGADFVEAQGGCVVLAPLVNGRSTSSLIQKILEAHT
ncbi:MAG TPA: D-glycero-beta-D-manno-heptose 1-phosphate adenylyltransferase [Tepidisphaeraceae bacterium]|jgi:D-beta-D-heptose 7-phosphate kinase/D-beta-D-heptose 1-phosphate adenosyltransferase|nr:D-glycero-beta-D-manno-heptose 1-phosphate adenylyltransferase [Tepidisphaeraceae bacterium]